MYTVVDRNGEKVLSSEGDFPVLDATDPFFGLIETLPEQCPVPISIIKLGILTQQIEPKDADVDIELRTEDIDSASTAIVSSKTLAAIEYVLFNHTDHLNAKEKKRVGKLCEASNLNLANKCGASETEVIEAISKVKPENLQFLRRETTPEYICEACGDVFNSESARSDHLEGCPEYRSSTQSAENMAEKTKTEDQGNHTAGEKNSGSDTVKCDYCGSTYESKSELTSHIIDCDDRPNNSYFQCQYCQNKYVSKQGLNDHLEKCKAKKRDQSKRNNESREHECKHCGVIFDFEHKLTKHEQSCSQRKSTNQAKQVPERAQVEEITGFVTHYDSEGGYGFISTSDLDGGRESNSGELTDVFFHVSEYPDENPEENDRLRFNVENTDQGFKAVKIKYNQTRPIEKWDDTFSGNRKRWGR